MHRAARLLRIAAVGAFALVLSACGTVLRPAQHGEPVTVVPAEPVPTVIEAPELPPPPPSDLWERIRRQLVWHQLENESILRERAGYLAQPRFADVIGARAGRYLHFIVEQVEQRGMPIELALVPLVESTLNPFAYSPQKAAGLWQIMPATATHLGLPRNWWYDGRLDLRASTATALDYLAALHEEFEGDWMLALAAYNAGKGRVSRAISRNRSAGLPSDYWSLNLPRETRRYVPRLIAVSSIIADPDRWQVALPEVPNEPAFVAVDSAGQIELLRAAQLAGLELSELRALNPGFLRWATSPQPPHEMLVPPEAADSFMSGIAGLTADDRVTWEHYRIRRGDSLIRIAKRFDTEVGLLREVNNIRGNLIRAGDTLMIPQGSAWSQSLALADSATPRIRRGYRVRRGDSLYVIASRFNVTIADIVDWNALDPGAYLQPGQQLTLYLPNG